MSLLWLGHHHLQTLWHGGSMRRSVIHTRIMQLLTICAAGLCGCSESARVTAPSDRHAASLKGATIDRTLQLIAVWASGPPNDLALAVGFEDTESLCTEQSFIQSPERGQAVLAPSGTVQLHTFTREAFVQVFDFAVPVA
jgi:hypothetical protein